MPRLKHMLCITGLTVILLTGCGGRADQGNKTDLSQYKTDYIGNASNVVNIVGNQEYPAGYTYESIEIQSRTEPYGLTVFLNIASDAGETLKTNAYEAFDLIGNMGVLEYRNAESNEIIASYDR